MENNEETANLLKNATKIKLKYVTTELIRRLNIKVR